MSRSKLFLHIGSPKTGSTYLQATASRRRGELGETGLLYPAATERGHGHHDVAFLLSGDYPGWATPQDKPLHELGEELGAECRGHAGDILISSENFYLFPNPEALRTFVADSGLAADRDICIIVYLRRQDQMLVSWYNQMVKALGEDRPFEAVLPEIRELGDYPARLAVWAQTFGEDAIVARNFDAAVSAPGGLWTDFLRVMGRELDAPGEEPGENGVNISLSRDLLEVQRIINRLPVSIEEKRAFHKTLMDLTAKGGAHFNDAPLLSNSERRSLFESYADSNARLSTSYTRDQPGFDTDDLDAPDGPGYPGLSNDTTVAVLAWLVLNGGSGDS